MMGDLKQQLRQVAHQDRHAEDHGKEGRNHRGSEHRFEQDHLGQAGAGTADDQRHDGAHSHPFAQQYRRQRDHGLGTDVERDPDDGAEGDGQRVVGTSMGCDPLGRNKTVNK